MSKASSRIPTFRSKGPQLNKPVPVKEVLASSDLGKKVQIADKVGILRYIGNVHFASGVWCGVELSKSQGKNDGLINGIRYFACPSNCGLMVPLSKVTLLKNEYENQNHQEDAESGPHSILFLDREYDEDDDLEKTLIAHDRDRTFDINNGVEEEKRNENNDGTFEVNKKNYTFTKSCENIYNDCCEIKRRRTNSKIDSTPVSILNNLEKPSSLPQLRSIQNNSFDYNNTTKICHSTPLRSEFEDTLLRKLQLSSNTCDDDSSKRDSLELEESLGILTPEQMIDGMSFMSMSNVRTPSSECIRELKDKTTTDLPNNNNNNNNNSSTNPGIIIKSDDLPSPNIVDASITEFSFGIIDEQLLNNLTLKTDTTMNMELPLDKTKDYTLTRLEQTPSPEDLPLDPTPIIESDTTKTEPSKSKTSSNSFITSITSITSLDTGYQGDGEMSRPASRGADNSPLTRRPLPRPQTRRPDPMTDSDFYTESDADNHEENALRGDRRAQVIDGTLYGVDPQAAADIYVNNRENMDSSGIFTDIESSNTRNDNNNVAIDASPDTSSKTISGNSQNNIQDLLDKTLTNEENEKNVSQKENPKKRNAPSPVISSPSSIRSPRHLNKDDIKKFKMPKREVASKVKAMLESTPQKQDNNIIKKSTMKKPASRWDAVMNKISKTESKTNLKDVKSKVFNTLTPTTNATRQNDQRKASPRQNSNQKTPNIKQRRIRTRTGTNNASPKLNVDSSIHSSLSDLSASGNSPNKSTVVGSAKKRDVVQVTQVLTASKLSPRNVQHNATTPESNKKSPTPSAFTKIAPKRSSPLVSKEKKQSPNKECGRTTVKGGRTSPVVRPPVHTRAPAQPAPKLAEALAVLVQHLVFNVEAYQVPVLKKDVQKIRREAEEIRLACQHLEETLAEERVKSAKAIEDEKEKCALEISELLEKHKSQILELNKQQYELEQRLLGEKEQTKNGLVKQNEEKLKTLKIEFDRLQKTHEESLDILREENDAIREQIDEKNAQIIQLRDESAKLKKDYEAKEMKLMEQLQYIKNENQKLKQDLSKSEEHYEAKLKELQEESSRLKDENDRLYNYSDNKEIGVQELQSLRVVLELKQNEVAELRRALAEATQKNEILAGAEEKAAALSARCEDLEHQLQRKTEYEQNLLLENKKLYDSFKEEINQKKRLCQHNEELQWKLQQNKEVVTKVLEQAAEESSFNRSLLTASFSERHNSSLKQNLERTLSFREAKNSSSLCKSKNEDTSPPTSPKVKGVIEKSDWVSYVLDLDESPDIVASRIVRRSFRNSTPPKTTPTKSPSNKKQSRTKNPLSLSASASAILPPSKVEYARSRSLSTRNGADLDITWVTSTPKRCEADLDLDEDDDVDLKLPALPSEIGRKNGAHQALPSPKHLAGEAMISESNSEDESTSSSSVQL